MGERISISTPDGSFAAYLARPARTPAGAVVVIQEIFGINADMRETCDWLAGEGYLAACPDLFWRQQPGVELNHRSDADWRQALALYNVFDLDKGVLDIAATAQAMRDLPAANGRVGVMGFCLGGLLTFLTVAREPVDAAVAYYGGSTDQHIDEANGVRSPLLMHLGEEDEFISKAAQRVIIDALAGNPQVEIHQYPGCSHAFARRNGAHFDAAAAATANARTLAFFSKHLA